MGVRFTDATDRFGGLLEKVVHPLVLVLISVLIAAVAFPEGLRLRNLGSEATSFIVFVGGAVFLVLIAAFFQQQLRARRQRAEIDQHFAEASSELAKMISALKVRSLKNSAN